MPEQLVEHLLYAVSLLICEVLIYNFFKVSRTSALELHFCIRFFCGTRPKPLRSITPKQGAAPARPATPLRSPQTVIRTLMLPSTLLSVSVYTWLSFLHASPAPVSFSWGVLVSFLVPLAAADARTKTIPNALLIRALVSFLITTTLAWSYALVRGANRFDILHQITHSLLGLVAVGGISCLVWHLAWRNVSGGGKGAVEQGEASERTAGVRARPLGGGDVKLFALCGLVLGFYASLTLMVIALCLAIFYALCRRLEHIPLAPAVLFAAVLCAAIGLV